MKPNGGSVRSVFPLALVLMALSALNVPGSESVEATGTAPALPRALAGAIGATAPARDPRAGAVMLPEVSVALLGPIASLNGHTWVRGYDWVHDKRDVPLTSTALDRSHRLAIHLPSGRALRHRSRATFFTQDHGVVVNVALMPLDVNVGYQDAIAYLEQVLGEWEAEPNERAKQAIARWKTYGNLQPDPILVNYSGYGTIKGEEKAKIFFQLRPASDGWFLSMSVAATTDEWRKLWNSPSTQAADPSDAATRPARDTGAEMLPPITVELLGPISALKGHNWPLGYDWVSDRANQPVSMTAADVPHELIIHLPSGRTIRHISGATFFSQTRGIVDRASLMPHPGLLPYQEAIKLLELILQGWDGEPDERGSRLLAQWKAEGDLKPWELARRQGSAILQGEDKVGVFFQIRPRDAGWYLVVDVAARWEQIQQLLAIPDSRPTTTRAARRQE
jgi:hypothetical protein